MGTSGSTGGLAARLRTRGRFPSPTRCMTGFDVAAKLAELRDDPAWKPEHEGPVLVGLTALKAIRNDPVGVLEFETDDYRKATELFVRFNSTGRKLRRGDLAMARLAIALPDLASSRIRPAADKWKAMVAPALQTLRPARPAPVYLVAGHHRTARYGPQADWAHAETVELDLVEPLRPCGGLVDKPREVRRHPLRKRQLGGHP